MNRTSMELKADIIIDKTSNVHFSYCLDRKVEKDNTEGFHFLGNNTKCDRWALELVTFSD